MTSPLSSSRPPSFASRPMIGSGFNTISGIGFADLVSKFETLQKTPGISCGPPRPPSSRGRPAPGLSRSQTLSALKPSQDFRGNYEKTKQNELVKPASPSPLSPASVKAATATRAKLATPKLDTSPSKKLNDRHRMSASVAEKRRLFEAYKAASKKSYNTPTANTKSRMTNGAIEPIPLTRAGSPNCNISMPHPCELACPTPKTTLNTPTKATPTGFSPQTALRTSRSLSKPEAIRSLGSSSLIMRLPNDDDVYSTPTGPEKLQNSNLEFSQHQALRYTHTSSPTGSPMKKISEIDNKSFASKPAPLSPIADKKREPLAPTSPPNTPSTPTQFTSNKDTALQRQPSDSTGSVIIAKKPETIPQSARRWSPQRIVTPQKPTMSKQASPIGQSQGEGKFVKSKNTPKFRDAVGFFEAMSSRTLNTNPYMAPREPVKDSADETCPSAKPPASKREKLKGSLRRLSSSLKLKKVRATQDSKLLSEYPAMWKLGGVEPMPRKRLHAEWCELSADQRKPLGASMHGEISLFDQYLSTSHSKSYRGPKGEDAHVNVFLQQSSLHEMTEAGKQDASETDALTDRSTSPTLNSSETLKPRRRPTRRWFSRSSGTLVSQVHCQLEQPRPVHGIEMKRLMSLCRMQGTLNRRGHTE